MKKFIKILGIQNILKRVFLLIGFITFAIATSNGAGNYVISVCCSTPASGHTCSDGSFYYIMTGDATWDQYYVRVTDPNGVIRTYCQVNNSNWNIIDNAYPGTYHIEVWHIWWGNCNDRDAYKETWANLGYTACPAPPYVISIIPESAPGCHNGIVTMSNGYSFQNLSSGYQTLFGTYWCSCNYEPYSFNVYVPANQCPPPPFVTSIVPESFPGCKNGIVYMSNGDVFYNLYSGNQNVNGQYLCSCYYTPYSVNVTVPGNPCQVTLSIDKADAIANCVNGSMVITTTDAGTFVYHVVNLYDAASNLLRTKTFYSNQTDFSNVIPGDYTVEVRTYASNSSSCYCSDTKQVSITSAGPVFYSPTITANDVGAHGCTNGSIKVDFNNVNDNYYLNYWNVAYKARYTAYLYDASWNVLTSANNLFDTYTFTNLAPGYYNILTVGTRYDAQGCNTPVWKNATINQPSCITFDALISTNTTTRCADDGTITASFTNWAGACDGYIKLYKVTGTEELIDTWMIGDGALPITWSSLQSSLVFGGNYRVEAHAGDCTISQIVSIGMPSCAVTVVATGSTTSGCIGNIAGTITNACASKTISLYKGANLVTTLTTTGNTFNFTGLSSGAYSVSLTASDNLAGCTATATAKVKNAVCPVAVNLSATQDPINSKKVLVSWDNYPCAIGYALQFRIAGMPTWSTYYQLTTNSKTLTNVFKNTVYEYRVRTDCSPYYNSGYSATHTFCFGNCGTREGTIAENTLPYSLTIYPNPANDYVMVESGLSSDNILAVNVYDRTGRLVTVIKSSEGETLKINTNNFTEGIYIVEIISPDAVLKGKFIIQR